MQKKFKIVHCITGLQRGGAETFLVDLIGALGTDRYEHHIVYFYSGPLAAALQEQGHQLHQITGLIAPYDPWFVAKMLYNLYALRPDIIHSHLWSANVLARCAGRLFGIPVINTLHSPLRSEDGSMRLMIDRATLFLATAICSVSSSVDATWQPAFSKKSVSRWVTIPNGIAIAQTPESVRSSDTEFVIGAVGRFIPSKRFDLLIDAFALFAADRPDARLLIIGLGEQEELLRRRVETHQLESSVTFLVGKPAREYYPQMDCFVLASEREGMSIALLEAMGSGVPVLVRTDQMTHDVITDGVDGLLLHNGHPEHLAYRLGQLYHDREFLKKLGSAGKKTMLDRYHISRSAGAYQQLYQEITKEM